MLYACDRLQQFGFSLAYCAHTTGQRQAYHRVVTGNRALIARELRTFTARQIRTGVDRQCDDRDVSLFWAKF